jgi:hypothetical protein
MKLAQESMKLAQEFTKLAQESMKLAQESTKLAQESTKLAQESTKLAQEFREHGIRILKSIHGFTIPDVFPRRITQKITIIPPYNSFSETFITFVHIYQLIPHIFYHDKITEFI